MNNSDYAFKAVSNVVDQVIAGIEKNASEWTPDGLPVGPDPFVSGSDEQRGPANPSGEAVVNFAMDRVAHDVEPLSTDEPDHELVLTIEQYKDVIYNAVLLEGNSAESDGHGEVMENAVDREDVVSILGRNVVITFNKGDARMSIRSSGPSTEP